MRNRESRPASGRTPFLDRQFLIFCLVFVTLIIGVTVWQAASTGDLGPMIVVPALAIAFSIYAWQRFQRPIRTLEQMQAIILSCREGDLHRRITNAQGLGEVGKVAWEMNEFLDIVETYFKEINTCFDSVARGEYHRRALDQGLPGEFASSLQRINVAIEAMEEGARFVVRNRLGSQLHALNISNLLSNLKGNQSDLVQVSDEMDAVMNIAEDNRQGAGRSREDVLRLSEALEQINDRMQAMAGSANELGEASISIDRAIQIISEITDQTNLLALNAAIEAARAGEVGRGFAVVADEVRKLAERTKAATLEISQIIGGFRECVSTMVDQTASVGQRSADLSEQVSAFREQFGAVARSSEATIEQLGRAKDLSFATLVKMSHVIYMQNVYVAMERHGASGISAQAAQAASEVEGTRVGEWYYDGSGEALFGRQSVFSHLDRPHRQVHEAVQCALQAIRSADEDEDRARAAVVAALETAEAASSEVMRMIGVMVSEKHGNASLR